MDYRTGIKSGNSHQHLFLVNLFMKIIYSGILVLEGCFTNENITFFTLILTFKCLKIRRNPERVLKSEINISMYLP